MTWVSYNSRYPYVSMRVRGPIIVSWLLLLLLNFLTNLVAGWGQGPLGNYKWHILFAFVIIVALSLYLQVRREGSPPSGTEALLESGAAFTFPARIRATARAAWLEVRHFFSSLALLSLHPKDFLAELDTNQPSSLIGPAVSFLSLSVIGQELLTGHVRDIATIWQSIAETVASLLLASLVTALSWKLVRGQLRFAKAFIIQAYVCGALFVFWNIVFFVSEKILTVGQATDLPHYAGVTFMTDRLWRTFFKVVYCSDDSSFEGCARQLGLTLNVPNVAVLSLYVVALVVVLSWTLVFWTRYLRETAQVGRGRALIAYLVFFTCSSVIYAVMGGSQNWEERDCGFAELPTTKPQLNPGPLTFEAQALCADYPLVDVGTRHSVGPLPGRTTWWSLSQIEHNIGLPANIGDELSVRIFLENGAADNSDPRLTTAKHVTVGCKLERESLTRHVLSVSVSAENAPSIWSAEVIHGGDAAVYTTTPSTLTYIAGTSEMLVSTEEARLRRAIGDVKKAPDAVSVSLPDGIVGGSLDVGDLRPGYRHCLLIYFRFRVGGSRAVPIPDGGVWSGIKDPPEKRSR